MGSARMGLEQLQKTCFKNFNLEILSNVRNPAHLRLAPYWYGQALSLMNQQHSHQSNKYQISTNKPKNPKTSTDPKNKKSKKKPKNQTKKNENQVPKKTSKKQAEKTSKNRNKNLDIIFLKKQSGAPPPSSALSGQRDLSLCHHWNIHQSVVELDLWHLHLLDNWVLSLHRNSASATRSIF